MTNSIAIWEFRHGDTFLVVLDGNFSIDELNVPAISGTFVVPDTPGLFDQLNPQTDPPPRIQIHGRRTYWDSLTVAEFSAKISQAGYLLVSDLTTAWSGWTVAEVTHYAGDPLNYGFDPSTVDPDDWPSQHMALSLHVREVSRDRARGTVAVTVASDEALLTDWSPISPSEVDAINALIPATDIPVGAVINAVMSQVTGQFIVPDVYDADLLPEPITMELGMSAWDMARAALDLAGDKLRPIPGSNGLKIERPLNNITGNDWFFGHDYLTEVTETRTRSGDWFDSALLISQNAAGEEVIIGHAPAGTHSRTYRESFAQGYPISSWQAENIVARSQHRGRRPSLVGPITMGVWIGDQVSYSAHPDDPPTGGEWQVASIAYDLRSDTMAMTLRPDPTNPPE